MRTKQNKLLNAFELFILFVAMTMAVSCGPVDSSPDLNEGYPLERPDVNPEAYPVEPLPTHTGTLLALDRPIVPNQTVISGVGPAGLTVTVMNITFLGEELGRAIISDDGTFSIDVNPLPAGVRIGVTADLAASGMTDADVRPGDGEVSTPRVGYFFDSVVIPQQN